MHLNLHNMRSNRFLKFFHFIIASMILAGSLSNNGFAASPSYEGWFESGDCNGLTGWAWDQNFPITPISVDLYADNVKVASVVANQFRQDILMAGKGGGEHGFTVAIPATLKDGSAHAYSIKFGGSGTALNIIGGSTKSISCAAVATVTGSEGWFENAACKSGLVGWAWNSTAPNTPVAVDVYANSVKVTSTVANLFRQDLLSAGKGNGMHGFAIPVPSTLKNNLNHTYTITFAGSSTVLTTSSAKSAICAAQNLPPPDFAPTSSVAVFEGWNDSIDCNIGVTGWAWDKNVPNSSVSVDVFADNVKFASVPANAYRPDLVSAGKGNGNHGFVVSLPDSLKNGVNHSYTANFSGTNTALNGGAKSGSCGTTTAPAPTPAASSTPLPAISTGGQFEVRLIPQPGVGPASPMKHLRLIPNLDNGLIFISSGDWSGAGSWYESYRQESYFYDVINDRWSLAHGYLSTSASDPVPSHPDQMGLAWDSKRKIFWQFPGYEAQPAAETGTLGVLTFDPIGKMWSIPAIDVMPQMQYLPSKFAQYDAQKDQLIQLGDEKYAHLSPATGKWTSKYYVNNGNGNRLIKGNYTALVGREIWGIDSRYNNLVKYNIDNHTIADVEPLPFIAPEETVNVVFDPVKRALVFLGDYSWTEANPNVQPNPYPFYVYWLDKPLGSRWEQRQFIKMPDQIRSIADSMVYHPQTGKIMMIGDTWAGNKYFYLYTL